MTTSDTILSARGVSKKHAHQLRRASWYGVCDLARELTVRGPGDSLRPGEFWALQDFDLDVRRGDAVAVVGANGAGKSTLLKLLAGLLKPDSGKIEIRGSVEAIIELGAAIGPLLSGRENVRMAAALHGLSRAQSGAYQEQVLDFAELGEFIDDPVQSYSSGMRARLAYAIVSQLKPDLLLIDEVLAVGDQSFQRKCMHHMRGYLRDGGALVLVSHNIHQIQAICDSGILLDKGRKVYEGIAVEAVSRSFALRVPAIEDERRAAQSGPVAITAIDIAPVSGTSIMSRSPLHMSVRYRSDVPRLVVCGLSICTEDESIVITGDSEFEGRQIANGDGRIDCVIRDLTLLPGRYVARASLHDKETAEPLALFGYADAGQPFDVSGEASLLTNAQIRQGQLVNIDVDWLR